MVAKEIAEQEFSKWFEAKKLPKKLLEKNADDKEAIISSIEEGVLSLNDDLIFTQKLNFPIKQGDSIITELSFKFRVTEGELSAAMSGIKADDLIGQIQICYLSALTGVSRGIIRTLDPTDSYVGKKIAAFFFI